MSHELTPDEADTAMANIHPENRRWCSIGCGPLPGEPPAPEGIGCACVGCIYGALSGPEFIAWQAREAQREPTPYVPAAWELSAELPADQIKTPTLADRLESYKARKR